MIYGIEGNVTLNPCELHFHRTIMHDAMAFHGMLAATADCIPGLRSRENAVRSAYHRGKALELLRRRIELDPNEASDAAIVTASSLQDIEVSLHAAFLFVLCGGRYADFNGTGRLILIGQCPDSFLWGCENGANSRRTGGIVEILPGRHLGTALVSSVHLSPSMRDNWLSHRYRITMITSPESMLGAGWPWTGREQGITPLFIATVTQLAPSILSLSSPLSMIAPIHDVLLACEQFLSFFHDLSEKRHPDHNTETPTAQARTSERRRITLFSPSSPLHRILATPPPASANMYDRTTTQDYCRLACLLNLTLALMAYSSLPDRFERYLQWLAMEIIRNNIDLSMRIEHLYYILMRGFRDDNEHDRSEDEDKFLTGSQYRNMCDAGERNWLVSRLLCVAKRLDRPDTQRLWHSVQNTLAQNLPSSNAGDANADSVAARPSIQDWKDDEIRKAVLGDLHPGPQFYVVASVVPDQFWDFSSCPETARLN